MSGVYKITNTINNKFYIGSTINFKIRFKDHKKFLNQNNHGNSYLQKSWNKNKEENFIFEIIEFIEDISKLLEREQYYLDTLQSWKRSIGYNICEIAGSVLGIKWKQSSKNKITGGNNHFFRKTHSDKQKESWSKFRVGVKNGFFNKSHSKETKQKMSLCDKSYIKKGIESPFYNKGKTVKQYSLDGILIKEFISVAEAKRQLNIKINAPGISLCCNDKASSAYGFIWKYK